MEATKRLDRTLKYQGKIISFYEDEILLPDGNHAQYDYIEHPKCAAAVIPVCQDGSILMVRQYRNAIDRFTLEIPAGCRDSADEPTIDCAARELEEETGHHSDRLEYLLTIRTTVAFCNEFVDIYVAHDLVETKQNLDPEEFVDVVKCSLDDLVDKVYAGEIQDSKTVAAIMAFKLKTSK